MSETATDAILDPIIDPVGYDGPGFCHVLQHLSASQLRRLNQRRQMAKILVVGEMGVGKTSLVNLLAMGTFTENVAQTMSVDMTQISCEVYGVPVALTVWDTAGQERFASLVSAYFKGADAIIICYDESNRNTANKVFSRWMVDLEAQLGDQLENIPLILVGNKDEGESVVDHTVLNELAMSKRMETYRMSAKQNWVWAGGERRPARHLLNRLGCLLVDRWVFQLPDEDQPPPAPTPSAPPAELDRQEHALQPRWRCCTVM